MKKSELKTLIKEEVRKVVREADSFSQQSYTHMKPYMQSIQQSIKNLQILNDKIETAGPLSEEIVDALEILEELWMKIKQAR
jgi:hypothetical protein